MEMSFSSPEIKPPRRSPAQTFQTHPCSPLANPLSHFTPPSSQQSPSTHQQVLSKPTRGQREAIEVLKDYEDCDVLAWLAFAGAIGIDFRFRPKPRAFSRQLVNAIAVLCDSRDTIVLEWLQAARTEGLSHQNLHVCIAVAKSLISGPDQHEIRSHQDPLRS